MDHERKIGKVSGAVNMAKLNQSGREGVESMEEVGKLLADYKKKYSEMPDLDSRCRFFVEMDAKEKADFFKMSKKRNKF